MPSGPDYMSTSDYQNLISAGAPVTPAAAALPTPAVGDYASTVDYQNLISSGQGVPTTPFPAGPDYMASTDYQNLISSGQGVPTTPFPGGPDYMSTSDYQNLISSGQGVPTPAASTTGDLGGGLRVPGVTPARGYDSFMSPTRDGIGSLSGAPRAAATGFQQAPSAMDLFKQGEYVQGTKELFSPTSYTNQQLIQSPQYQQYVQAGFKPTEALKMASSDLNPGMLRTYGPTAAAGVAALGAMGGFTAQEPEAPGIVPQETGFDLLARSPEIYGTTPGGAATQYFTPQYMGYGLPTQQYRPAQYNFAPIQYAAYQRPRTYAGGGDVQKYAEGGSVAIQKSSSGPLVGSSDGRYRPADIFYDTETKQYVSRSPVYTPEQTAFMNALGPAKGIGQMVRQIVSPLTQGSYEYTPLFGGATTAAEAQKPFFVPGGANIVYPEAIRENLAGMSVTPTRLMAAGGIASLKKGGTPNFPRKNGAINGPGTGTSDDIPAMLSDGEFVFTAKAVRGMGKGSRRLGAKRMYAMMKALEGKA